VYEGSVPFIAMEPFLKLEGGGKWAVPVAVYGNRSEWIGERLKKMIMGPIYDADRCEDSKIPSPGNPVHE